MCHVDPQGALPLVQILRETRMRFWRCEILTSEGYCSKVQVPVIAPRLSYHTRTTGRKLRPKYEMHPSLEVITKNQ